MTTKLLRVAAKHLVAGIDVERGVITHTAPILKWAIGLTEAEFRQRCTLKAWQVEEVPRASIPVDTVGKQT